MQLKSSRWRRGDPAALRYILWRSALGGGGGEISDWTYEQDKTEIIVFGPKEEI